ncbi:mediator of rna polymerase ii transcription subunit 19a [Quercus suber]|uniref:Mediator of rna polymerase ii transcription subunit 19a n=1 Tax=Quercus suber TaxID=58331 RepID=A0AAW0KY48_QUESU
MFWGGEGGGRASLWEEYLVRFKRSDIAMRVSHNPSDLEMRVHCPSTCDGRGCTTLVHVTGGPRELSGAVDLINQYKLWPHHEFFCKRPLPLSVSQTHYLRNVVGDTEIRRGEGMELDQLSQSISYLRERNAHIRPFHLDALWEAFQMRETTPVYLTDAEKGMLSAGAKSNDDSRDQKRKHKKHKDKDKKKDKDHKKHKHRQKDKSDDKDKNRDGHLDLKQQDKKRRHEGNGDLFDSRKHQKARLSAENNSLGLGILLYVLKNLQVVSVLLDCNFLLLMKRSAELTEGEPDTICDNN